MATFAMRAAPPDQLLGEPTAGDMSGPAKVSVADTDSPVLAYALVRRSGAGVAVVHRCGEPIGVVDEQRLHLAALRTMLADPDANGDTVASCLPRRRVRILAEAPLGAAAAMLLDVPGRAALVYRGSTFIGVLTASDVLNALAHPKTHAQPA